LKNKNTYENTDLTDNGAKKHISGLHHKCISTNQYIWDMMKVLDQEEMYGFHFQAKVGATKIMVILHHESKEQLIKAQKILKNVEKSPDVLFLTKVKEKKRHGRIWVIMFSLIAFLVVFSFILNFLYKEGYLNGIIEAFKTEVLKREKNSEEKQLKKEIIQKEPVVEEIAVDIQKLKSLKESFSEQNNTTLSPKVMQSLSITTDIISDMVSEEEKAKYSAEVLVKSFKGKSGIKLVVKEDNENKDFNTTVEELNAYAMHFVKDNNFSEALKSYGKVLHEKSASKKEIMVSSYHQAEIFKEMGLNEEAQKKYIYALKLSEELYKENNQTFDALNRLVILDKLAEFRENFNETKKAEEIVKQSKKLYQMLIKELKKGGEVKQEELALALNYLATFYENRQEYSLAIEMRKEALKIYEKLLKKAYKKFALTYYKSLNALANNYLMTGKIELAKKNYEKALGFMQKLLNDKIVNSKVYLAHSYRALGGVAIKKKELKRAKEYYVKALEIYQHLAKKDKTYRFDVVDMNGDFANLYTLEKKFSLATEAYQNGIYELIQMNKTTPLKYNLKIANLLNRSALMKFSNYDMNSTEVIQAKIELRESITWSSKVIDINFKKAKESMVKSYAYLAYIVANQNKMKLAREYYKTYSILNRVKSIKSFRLLNFNLEIL